MKIDDFSEPGDHAYPFRASRVAVIGLDCASPVLMLDKYIDHLPNLRRLCSRGIFGELRSIIPPITVPAWACMMSGKDPGQLGIYGFRNRKDYSYDNLFIANSEHVTEKRVWDLLGESDYRSILLGVPPTYPATPTNGLTVGCFLAPEKNANFTYPRWLRAKIDGWAGGDYLVDVKEFRTDKKDWLLEQVRRMSRARTRLAERLLEEDWDFFMMVEMGVDRLYHGFWRYCDPNHRLYTPGNPYENTILNYHVELDGYLGRLIEKIPDDTLILIVSDHGARRMVGGFATNEWLRREGLLVLKQDNAHGKLTPEMIDWSKTKVWSEGGYYARLFLNVAGREPQGVIQEAEYDSFREQLSDQLKWVRDQYGNLLKNEIYSPGMIYKATKGVPPDLIMLPGGLDYRSLGSIGHSDVLVFENDTGPDDANHDMLGIIVAAIKGRQLPQPAAGRKLQTPADIYDVAPTILKSLQVNVPSDMIGHVIDPWSSNHQ
jgi:predicted AlkP superfamily phosphohydrolase/phosphomutase